ncbi:MAG: SHOCT domain-containing protein [Solirubrobacterales bacterium]
MKPGRWRRPRATAARSSPPAVGSDAHELLDRRLAAGEIDVEEYERRRRALRPPS